MSLYEKLDIPLIIQTFDISKYFDSEVLKDAMASLYEAGVKGKLYRLWFELNRETEIRVRTGVGTTQVAVVGETVAQGSIGGGLVSSLNLDVEVNNFFEGSMNEAGYSYIRFQPMILQDDLSRLCTSAESARTGIRRIEIIMKLKQLSLNVKKSSYIVCQNSSKSQEIKDDLLRNPILYDKIPIKEKLSEKYLGDMIDGGGLAASVDSTISERYGRIYTSILEVKVILEDYRSSTAGGIRAGIMLWEMAIIPSLLNNSETWIFMSEESIKKLENLQNMMIRIFFNTAITTPKAALLWDSGILPIEQQIEQKKLTFLHHLMTLPADSLANQVYVEQKVNQFPGLVTECQEIMQKYDLPDITEQTLPSRLSWKNEVKSKISNHIETKLKAEIGRMTKLENMDAENENFSAKSYLSELNLNQARTKFKLRSRMLEVKNNFKGGRTANNLMCDFCESSLETQDHILFCPAYRDLRMDMDLGCDMDLVNYVRQVLVRREKIKKK